MAAKTMTQLIEEAKEVRVYAPLKGRDVDLPKKRIASKGGHKKHLRAVKRLKKNIMR